MESRKVPLCSVLIRDRHSGLLIVAIALGWFLIGGWALFGTLLVGHAADAANKLPSAATFINLSAFTALAGIAAWLRFRHVHRTLCTGSRTTGVLTHVVGRSGGKLQFRFDHEGTSYQAVNLVLGGPLSHEGDTVDVVYDPTNPTRAYVWDKYVPK